ncbi:CocE/NonD family hydrolase [Rouxiella sp. WC2420]|uniref:CocE/NonD family hydrolase n=1 Tax=Rouxiella sp. WC2420 TaxID=3234145 RepID=A0AB39VUD3_9GAMM
MQSETTMTLLENVMITLRDGVNLATDIYLPAGSGPFPVVVERTPYNKRGQSRSEVNVDGSKLSRRDMAQALVNRGYAVVFQDCRGCYGSEGVFTKYTSEGVDGFDTLQWIIEQQWCNGDIGSMGLSYAAHTQLAMACLNPPGLKTMVLDSGGFHNAFQCGIRQGGAFELKQATWAYKWSQESPLAQQNPLIRKALEQENILDWFAQMPWFPGHSPLRHVPEYENYLFEQWSQGEFSDYWRQNGIFAAESFEQIPDMPVMFMSSWYDAYVSSTLDNFKAFCQGKTYPQRLIMGPWLHGDRNITFSGNAEFGRAAAFDNNVAADWMTCRLDWFDRWLKNPASKEAPHEVEVFVMGGGGGDKNDAGRLQHGGKWLNSDQWPLKGSQPTTLFLHRDGALSCEQPSRSAAPLSYLADPHHPVPTIGGSVTSGLPVFQGGAFDQRESSEFFGTRGDNLPLSARADVLVFQTPELEKDLLVAGDVTIKLWISSSALDTDFTAKLVDVYPPSKDYPQGYAMNITDGIIRCRYRQGWEKEQLLSPDEIVEVTIAPFATCNLFKKGHRIRLDIASSNFPRFDCNPNSGEPEGQARLKQTATNQVFVDSLRPSRLIISVLPL